MIKLDEAFKAIGQLVKDVAPSKRAIVLYGVQWLAGQALKASGVKVDPAAALKFLTTKLAGNDAVIAAYRKVVGK